MLTNMCQCGKKIKKTFKWMFWTHFPTKPLNVLWLKQEVVGLPEHHGVYYVNVSQNAQDTQVCQSTCYCTHYNLCWLSSRTHRRVADCFLHRCCHQPVRSIGLHRVWPRHGAALGCQVDLLSWRLKLKKSTNLTRLTNPNHQMYTSLLWVYSTGYASERRTSCADNCQSTAH